MWEKSTKPNEDKTQSAVEMANKEKRSRAGTYREQALKLFPWVCGNCGREFAGAKLRELTVHHKDHDHDNNPPDGSNWELLCLYCHDNEHSRLEVADAYGQEQGRGKQETTTTYKAFAGLEGLLKDEKD